MHRFRILLVGAAAVALLVASAGPVSAGDPTENTLSITVEPALPLVREAPTFEFEYDTDGDDACELTLEFHVIDDEDNPVDDVDIAQGTLTFGPSVPGGSYALVATCTDTDTDELEDVESMAFARGIVEKVVDGDAGDAAFTVEVACEGEDAQAGDAGIAGSSGGPFTLVFEYGPDGGEESFAVYGLQACEVTETDDGGADDVAVSGGFAFPDPADETVTVTNTFDAAAEPPAALPEEAAPDFTG